METRFSPNMKLIKFNTLVALCAALFIATPIAVLTPGCAYFQTAPGHDAVVVNAETTAKLSFAMVDGFLEWENSMRASVPFEVTKAADTLRAEFPQAYTSFRLATKAYKYNRTAENKADLKTWKALVLSALDIATKYLPAAQQTAAKAKAATMLEPPDTVSGISTNTVTK